MSNHIFNLIFFNSLEFEGIERADHFAGVGNMISLGDAV